MPNCVASFRSDGLDTGCAGAELECARQIAARHHRASGGGVFSLAHRSTTPTGNPSRVPGAGRGEVRAKAFANSAAGHAELLAWLHRQEAGLVHACLEATGTYGVSVSEALADAGHTVSVVNAAAIEAYGRSRLSRTKRIARMRG